MQPKEQLAQAYAEGKAEYINDALEAYKDDFIENYREDFLAGYAACEARIPDLMKRAHQAGGIVERQRLRALVEARISENVAKGYGFGNHMNDEWYNMINFLGLNDTDPQPEPDKTE